MQNTYDENWVKAEKEVDPHFEGSISQLLGLTDRLCPTCHAHLSRAENGDLICLNACHLKPHYRALFGMLLNPGKEE